MPHHLRRFLRVHPSRGRDRRQSTGKLQGTGLRDHGRKRYRIVCVHMIKNAVTGFAIGGNAPPYGPGIIYMGRDVIRFGSTTCSVSVSRVPPWTRGAIQSSGRFHAVGSCVLMAVAGHASRTTNARSSPARPVPCVLLLAKSRRVVVVLTRHGRTARAAPDHSWCHRTTEKRGRIVGRRAVPPSAPPATAAISTAIA